MKYRRIVFWAAALPLLAHAQVPFSSSADLGKSAIDRIQSLTKADDTEWIRMVTLWSERCDARPSDQICVITECDFAPKGCQKGNLLLFRGEEALYSLPATSALYRSRFEKSDYGAGIQLPELLVQFSEDLGILKSFSFAPQNESPLLIINSKTGVRQWVWKDSNEPVMPYESQLIPRTPALTAYSFHVEASFLYYRDDSQSKVLGIDPLISTTSKPKVAFSFASDPHSQTNPGGRVIVLSIPKKDLRRLCDPHLRLEAGTALDPRGCKDPLNENSDEQEFDLVLYPKPEWVYRSFLVK